MRIMNFQKDIIMNFIKMVIKWNGSTYIFQVANLNLFERDYIKYFMIFMIHIYKMN